MDKIRYSDDTANVDYISIARQYIHEHYPRIEYRKPTLQELEPGTIVGTWSWSKLEHYKYILPDAPMVDIDVMPADLARAWVNYNYSLPLRRRKTQHRSYLIPLKALKGLYPDCAYVDIKGAYRRVLSYGYDVDYKIGGWLQSNPIHIGKQMAREKFAYSIAVAMSARARGHIEIKTKEGKMTEVRNFNIYSNPCLYALASEILACTATIVSKYIPTYYIHTDGYIIPNRYVETFGRIMSDLNWKWSTKAVGNAEVYGVASWKVGAKKTLRRDVAAHDFETQLPSMDIAKWLFRKLDRYAIPDYT